MTEDLKKAQDDNAEVNDSTNTETGPKTEPVTWGVAQLKAVLDPKFPKDAALFEIDGTSPTVEALEKRVNGTIKKLRRSDRKKLEILKQPDGQGIWVYEKGNKDFEQEFLNTPQDNDGKAQLLNYTENVTGTDSTVVVRNKQYQIKI